MDDDLEIKSDGSFDRESNPEIGKTVVVDSGTYNIRAGYSGEKEPTLIRNTADWDSLSKQSDQPIIAGKINNWDQTQELWQDLFENKLEISCEEHPIVMTEAFDVSKKERERITEMLFSAFAFPAIYVSPSPLFSLYSTGRTSGIVVDMAYDTSRILPVYEGYALQLNGANFHCGGQHLSHEFATLIENKIQISTKYAHFSMNLLEDMKRRCCTVVPQNVKASEMASTEYKLPDDSSLVFAESNEKVDKIEVGSERAECCEMLFNLKQSGTGKDANDEAKYTFCETIYNCIDRCQEDSQDEMFGNVVLSGGTSNIEGMQMRVRSELNQLIEKQSDYPVQLRVIAPPNRSLSAWVGASIFSSLDSFSRAFVTMEEFDEVGPRIVHHKCF